MQVRVDSVKTACELVDLLESKSYDVRSGVLEPILNRFCFVPAHVHTTVKTEFVRIGSGGGFGEFDSADLNL